MSIETYKAFYFTNQERKLGYGDRRSIRVGQTHKVDTVPSVCRHGLHASTYIMDALNFEKGPVLYLVELSGHVDVGDDKLAAQRRKYICSKNIEPVLRAFARRQALINIDKIKTYVRDSQSWDLLLDYLNTGNPGLQSAAESAVRSAAESAWAAEAASRSAVASVRSAVESSWSAAESAAWLAAWSATRSATRSAAWFARSAVESAAESAADKMLFEMVKEYTGWDMTGWKHKGML